MRNILTWFGINGNMRRKLCAKATANKSPVPVIDFVDIRTSYYDIDFSRGAYSYITELSFYE